MQRSSAASHVAKVLSSVKHGGDASALISSWRRCVSLYGLSPDGAPEPERHGGQFVAEARQRNEMLTTIAAGVMDHLLFDASDHMIFLTEAYGTVLETRSLRTSDFWERPRGDWAGTNFSEERDGTNGVGTALREKRALTVTADQHFHVRNIHAVCSAAPIFGPDGNIAGCINVSSSAERTAPFLSALIFAAVVESARRIEIGLLANTYPSSRLTLASQTGQHLGAVLAVDKSGCIVGATRAARALLDVEDKHLNGTLTVDDLWDKGATADLTLAAVTRRAIEIALARYKGNVTAAAKALGVSRSTLLRKVSEFRREIRHMTHFV